MYKVISCCYGILKGLLHSGHSLFRAPFLHGLDILEPRTAMIYGRDIHSFIIDSLGLKLQCLYKLLLRHSGISAVPIYLIERSREIYRGIVPLRSPEGGPDQRD